MSEQFESFDNISVTSEAANFETRLLPAGSATTWHDTPGKSVVITARNLDGQYPAAVQMFNGPTGNLIWKGTLAPGQSHFQPTTMTKEGVRVYNNSAPQDAGRPYVETSKIG